MITSKLLQVEKSITVIFEGREYSVILYITNTSTPTCVDIYDDEGDPVKEDTRVGIAISEHVIDLYYYNNKHNK